MHHLTVRATDSVTGIYAEVAVSVVVEDVNDCSPEFSADSYHISVSEAAPFSTLVIKLEAHDNDTGLISVQDSLICNTFHYYILI